MTLDGCCDNCYWVDYDSSNSEKKVCVNNFSTNYNKCVDDVVCCDDWEEDEDG